MPWLRHQREGGVGTMISCKDPDNGFEIHPDLETRETPRL